MHGRLLNIVDHGPCSHGHRADRLKRAEKRRLFLKRTELWVLSGNFRKHAHSNGADFAAFFTGFLDKKEFIWTLASIRFLCIMNIMGPLLRVC